MLRGPLMGHYKSNLRDIEFNLFELFDVAKDLGSGPFAEMDLDSARGVLQEFERLCTEDLAESFADADRNPPVYDPETYSVTLPQSFKDGYAKIAEGGWNNLYLPPNLGGFGAPYSLRWACSEMILGANPAMFMYMAGPVFATIVERMGTPEQKVLARTMVEHLWGATMVLTEPDAGSDVGAGRTVARPQPDGTWHIEGVKRFITSAEWDVPDNIVHLVLARPVDTPGAGGPGTKGLSLFIVPKFHVTDWSTGELGERNGAFVTNVEKKMGLKVSTTCELTFGQNGTPAVGWLVGEVHDGIAQMFQVIEYARMMVGTKAISTLSTGYLNALDYAKNRVQGADMAQMTDKTAPRVSITRHPDVRRSLMLQKAYAEGMRSLVLYTARVQDRIEMAEHAGTADSAAAQLDVRINDLLLPIVKGVGSERAYELLSSQSLQTLGGSGYLQDYPIEQYIRDAKIDTLYEGTTAIQGMDLFFRKIVRDQGQALTTVATEIQNTVKGSTGDGLDRERELLGRALEDVQGMVGTLVSYLTSSAEDTGQLYKVGLHSSRFLMALGDLIIGWLLVRGAEVAATALTGTPSPRDKPFYEGKVAAAQFFTRTVLPRLAAERLVIDSADAELMQLDEAAF
jgi:alkylation response protein AidB-like acyl-CoA dehydrogenase